MKKDRVMTSISIFFLLLFFPGVLLAGEADEEQATGPAVRQPPGIVVVSPSIQKESGIAPEKIRSVFYRKQLTAYGTVLSTGNLFDQFQTYSALKSKADSAALKAATAEKQYERMKILNSENKNVSDMVLQEAEAAWRSAELDTESARAALETTKATIARQWGDRIGSWIFGNTGALKRLLEGKDVLVQVSLPPGSAISKPPETISIQAPGGAREKAAFVSRSPVVNPRIQGVSFFYLAPAAAGGLAPGMVITAGLPAKKAVKGILIPDSAIVWWEGEAWAYVLEGTDKFIRREVATDHPVEGGYLVTSGFRPGEPVVVKEAQLLFSKELLPKAPKEEEED